MCKSGENQWREGCIEGGTRDHNFANFLLTEKYDIWIWISWARKTILKCEQNFTVNMALTGQSDLHISDCWNIIQHICFTLLIYFIYLTIRTYWESCIHYFKRRHEFLQLVVSVLSNIIKFTPVSNPKWLPKCCLIKFLWILVNFEIFFWFFDLLTTFLSRSKVTKVKNI